MESEAIVGCFMQSGSIGFIDNAMFLTEVYDVSAGIKRMGFCLVNGSIMRG